MKVQNNNSVNRKCHAHEKLALDKVKVVMFRGTCHHNVITANTVYYIIVQMHKI